jgi:hypothetical protein
LAYLTTLGARKLTAQQIKSAARIVDNIARSPHDEAVSNAAPLLIKTVSSLLEAPSESFQQAPMAANSLLHSMAVLTSRMSGVNHSLGRSMSINSDNVFVYVRDVSLVNTNANNNSNELNYMPTSQSIYNTFVSSLTAAAPRELGYVRVRSKLRLTDHGKAQLIEHTNLTNMNAANKPTYYFPFGK